MTRCETCGYVLARVFRASHRASRFFSDLVTAYALCPECSQLRATEQYGRTA